MRADDKERPKWLFRYNSSFISYWEIFIILVAIVNSLTIPFQVFYGEYMITTLESNTFLLIDAFID